MKSKISVIILIFAFSIKVNAQEKFKLSYSGFYQDVLMKWSVQLEFELINRSDDTLYLSSENIKYSVFKNGKKLKEKIPNFGIGTPFIRPRFHVCPQEKIIRQKLAQQLVEKVQKGNQIDFSNKKASIQQILSDCIVLYPGEITYVKQIFFNDSFDKHCEVKSNYVYKSR